MLTVQLSPVGKFIVAMISAVGATTIAAIVFGFATLEMYVTGGVSLLGALSVYQFANAEYGWQKYTKGIVAILTAIGIPTLTAVFAGHLTPQMFEAGIVAAIGAAGVIGTPNTNTPGIDPNDYISPDELEEIESHDITN